MLKEILLATVCSDLFYIFSNNAMFPEVKVRCKLETFRICKKFRTFKQDVLK